MKISTAQQDSVTATSSGRQMKGKTTTTPCCRKVGIKRGPWTPEEDEILAKHVKKEGEGQWRTLPEKAGLLRCGKSCRLRWMNYLRPSVKRGRIAADEEDLILRLHRLLGNRWSLIAGRIPGRTDNEIKNYWNTHLSKKLISQGIDPRNHKPLNPNIPTSSSSPQIVAPKSAQHLMQTEPDLPHQVTATRLTQSFTSMENHPQNIDDYCFQIPSFNSGIGCWPSSSHDPEQSAAYCIENGNENGNGNEDHGFSLLLDSIINDDEYFYLNQEQQQQLQVEQMQQLQQPNATEPFANASAAPNVNNAVLWEAGVLPSMADLGYEDANLDSS